jgi:hypothetical protein
LIIKSTTDEKCGLKCSELSWCKSFDYSHIPLDKTYKTCWLYELDQKINTQLQSKTESMYRHYKIFDYQPLDNIRVCTITEENRGSLSKVLTC